MVSSTDAPMRSLEFVLLQCSGIAKSAVNSSFELCMLNL